MSIDTERAGFRGSLTEDQILVSGGGKLLIGDAALTFEELSALMDATAEETASAKSVRATRVRTEYLSITKGNEDHSLDEIVGVFKYHTDGSTHSTMLVLPYDDGDHGFRIARTPDGTTFDTIAYFDDSGDVTLGYDGNTIKLNGLLDVYSDGYSSFRDTDDLNVLQIGQSDMILTTERNASSSGYGFSIIAKSNGADVTAGDPLGILGWDHDGASEDWCELWMGSGCGFRVKRSSISWPFVIEGETGNDEISLGAVHSGATMTNWVLKTDTANQKFGAFSATPIVKPTVTGSRGGNAALASFLTALADLGWITNSSSA